MKEYFIIQPNKFVNEYYIVYVNTDIQVQSDVIKSLIAKSKETPNMKCRIITKSDAYKRAHKSEGCFSDKPINILELSL